MQKTESSESVEQRWVRVCVPVRRKVQKKKALTKTSHHFLFLFPSNDVPLALQVLLLRALGFRARGRSMWLPHHNPKPTRSGMGPNRGGLHQGAPLWWELGTGTL